ncbi:carboxypeptidase regulatory-like domain-containing protein [Granulicella sp. 5B5]|uniref:TonB-dependent receptor n=1 Tax=Granulicella sp. 5B5 TaxID=1617967 RepID=UPI0015F40B09|nr:carboxypeptidase-like regulatory domain-containing protein [Granulicella sp. 5B5]QMV19759.1 carboxypeptidase regulatory-like domain-containing protein [Granulicella sp. 5B5]
MKYARLYRFISGLPILLLLSVFSAAPIKAQTNYGSVRGLVSDSQNAAVAGAKVTLTADRTHVSRTEVTNGSGIYFFGAVDPGSYSVSVEESGFKTGHEIGLITELGVTKTLDFKLAVGSAEQTVDVSASTEELINNASASNGQLYDERKLQDLPNLGRNPFIMDKLDSNVIPTGNPQQARAEDQNMTSSVSIAGAPIGTNGYVVDGIPTSTSAGIVTFIPSLEAVSEVKVQANTYDAEAGRVGGGLYNATLKSGNDQLHGVLYGETRQTPWSANSFYSNLSHAPRPGQATYLYSGALGGPLPLDKIPGFSGVPLVGGKYYFWITEDGYRQQQPYAASSTAVYVPTAAERLGDFTQSDNPGPTEPTLYDPTQPFVEGKRTAVITGMKNGIPTPNYIPGSDVSINPIGQFIANSYPLPNVALASSQAYGTGNRALPQDSLKTRSDMYSGKLDHQFNSRWSAAASYVHLATQEPSGSVLHVKAEGIGVLTRYNDATAINNTILLSPTTVLNVAYGFNRYYSTSPQYSNGFDQTNGFGGTGFSQGFVSRLQSATFPTITPSGVASLGGANSGPTINYSRNFVISVSKTIGRHNVKAGYVYRGLRDYTQSFSGGNGAYNFNGQYTSINGASASTTSGNSIADLLLGAVSSASVTINAPYTLQLANYSAFYGQDDFRLNNALTVNLGLRLEVEPGQSEANNRFIVGFNKTIQNPLSTSGTPLLGGVEFAGTNGYSTKCCQYGAAKYSPRLGLAYSLDKKTVLRAGFGLFYAPVALTNYSPGYSQTTTYSTSNLTAATPASNFGTGAYLSNPFPGGLLAPSGNSLGYLTGVGGSITGIDSSRRYPLVQQYSVDLQRELPGHIALKVGYVGAHTRNFENTVNINQLPNRVLFAATGTSLATPVANPFHATTVGGYPATGLVSQTTLSAAQLQLPFPEFSSVTLSESNGYSRYNALAVKVQRSFRNGLTVLGTYTWSSNWDNIYSSVSAPATSDNLNATAGPQDNTNPKAEYARAADDVPNRATLVITYDLPFGRGRAYLSGINRWANAFLGGWQFNDETIVENGGPLSITQTDLNSASQYGTTGVGGAVQRPNLVPGVPIAKSGRPQGRLGPQQNGTQTYFNTAAFTVAPAYTYGNAPRTLPVYGPGYDDSDLSINKSFHISQRADFQFRAEALNAFNTPEFAAPVTVLPVNTGSQTAVQGSTFGQITSQINYARIIQLGGRFSF